MCCQWLLSLLTVEKKEVFQYHVKLLNHGFYGKRILRYELSLLSQVLPGEKRNLNAFTCVEPA